MQVETIREDPDIARVHYLRYRDQVRKHREERKQKLDEAGKEAGKELGRVRIAKTQVEKEDEELKLAYRALSQGKQLINIPKVLEGANLNSEDQLPNFAIAKADWKFVYLHWTSTPTSNYTNRIVFSEGSSAYGKPFSNKSSRIEFPRDTFPAELWNQEWRGKNNFLRLDYGKRPKAMVPSIPPHLRPDDLSKFYILWDAVWEEDPPVDPILLSRINDRMYAVVAQWDLTPLEQQVLEGRFS